jgi:hypothetical protein
VSKPRIRLIVDIEDANDNGIPDIHAELEESGFPIPSARIVGPIVDIDVKAGVHAAISALTGVAGLTPAAADLLAKLPKR